MNFVVYAAIPRTASARSRLKGESASVELFQKIGVVIDSYMRHIEDQEEDEEPFEEKMTRLTTELSKMFAKSHELEEEIRKRLGAIGYEI